MGEVTIRAESVVKLTDGLMDATWTFKAGTPRSAVLRDLSGGHYQFLQQENQRFQTVNKQLSNALVQILGWRELRDNNSVPIDRIEEIAREAISISEDEVHK